jgi:hypothetical protein
MPTHGFPSVLMALLRPELLEPLHALAGDPAARQMHREVAVTVPHVVIPLHVGVELALRVNADVVAHELVLKHEVFDCILFGSGVVLAHEQGVVRHHFEDPAREGSAAEEGAAGVDALVILRDQNVDVLYAEFLRNVVCKGYFRVHYDDVGVDQPDPFGVGVEGESFGNGGNFGPCLREIVSTTVACAVYGEVLQTHPVCVTDIIATCVQPQVRVAMLIGVRLAVLQHLLQKIGNRTVVASTITRS